MIGKVLSVLMCTMCMATSALAAQVTPIQSGIPIDTTGGQMTLFCAQMDNGQVLYCMRGEANRLWHKMEDVNFDGHADFVTFPMVGARNVFAEFYVYRTESDRYEYAPVWNGQLCNYALDAARQWVISQAADGICDYTKNVNGEIICEQSYPEDETGEQDRARIAVAREALVNGL